jgi:hypothetical protein
MCCCWTAGVMALVGVFIVFLVHAALGAAHKLALLFTASFVVILYKGYQPVHLTHASVFLHYANKQNFKRQFFSTAKVAKVPMVLQNFENRGNR